MTYHPESPHSGLTEIESKIITYTIILWNNYLDLPNKNNSDTQDIMNAIHTVQRIMATRHMRRNFEDWKQDD